MLSKGLTTFGSRALAAPTISCEQHPLMERLVSREETSISFAFPDIIYSKAFLDSSALKSIFLLIWVLNY